MKLVSRADVARLRGVSKAAITQAVSSLSCVLSGDGVEELSSDKPTAQGGWLNFWKNKAGAKSDS